MTTLGRAAATAAVYFLAARYSVALFDLAGLGAIFWPGAGVTVTALLVSPRRAWPAIVAAVGVAELANDLQLGFGWYPSLWWALANMVEPVVAALLIERWRATSFADVRQTLRFALAAIVGPAVGGLIGAVGTVAGVSVLSYLIIAGQWLIGDGLGILTMVPLGLVVLGRVPASRLWTVEGVAAMVTVAASSVLVWVVWGRAGELAADYLVLLPMVWAAVRLRVAGAAVGLFIVAQVGLLAVALGRGPATVLGASDVQSSTQMQLFLAAIGLTVLLLASRTVESETYSDLADMRAHLIGSVSHELRTPLTPIVGFSEFLLQRFASLDSTSRQALEAIHRNGLHLTALVEELLLASQASRGMLPVHPELVDVGEVVGRLLHDRDDAVSSNVEPGSMAWVDPTHLRQILTNLLDNAHRHGRPPVRIDAQTQGPVTAIAVADVGDGVPDWFEPRLFDKFAQTVQDDRRSTMGLGIGLSIARDLAEANGGRLEYVDDGPGAEFVVIVPAHAPTGDESAEAGD